MFSDEPAELAIQRATKISDLKNLGPKAAESFHRAGIQSVDQFKKLGWKKALVKLIALDPKNRHTLYAYALIGALTNKEWNALPEEHKIEAKEFIHSLKPKK